MMVGQVTDEREIVLDVSTSAVTRCASREPLLADGMETCIALHGCDAGIDGCELTGHGPEGFGIDCDTMQNHRAEIDRVRTLPRRLWSIPTFEAGWVPCSVTRLLWTLLWR